MRPGVRENDAPALAATMTEDAQDLPLRDEPAHWPVTESLARFHGRVISVVSESVTMPGGNNAWRDYIEHPGSVGVLALDGNGRVLVLRQYRHPARAMLWEIPAGLLDVSGESALAAAKRELHEEAGYQAATWNVLTDILTTPGGSNEAVRIFLARDVRPVAEAERYVGVDEETDMPVRWVPLPDLVNGVLQGDLHSPALVVGALALAAASSGDGARIDGALRPADAPWPARAQERAG